MAEITIPVAKDAHTQSYSKGANHGGTAYLCVDADSHPNNRNKGYLEFDISSVPADADIASVVVWLYRHASAYTPGDLYFDRLTSQFVESEITWNNSPGIDTSHRYTYDMPPKAWAWRSFDITQLYLDARALGDYLGVRMYGQISSVDGCDGQFGTKEYSKYFPSPNPAYLKITTVELPPLAFADVAISRRWGDKLYLSGKLEHIQASDEICVMYSRPGGGGLLNLKGAILDYTYLKGVVGQLTFDTGGKYLEFLSSGYYIFEAWDVTDDCETRSQKRASWTLNVTQPKYQYQLIFDVEDPTLGDNAYLLQAEWDKYNASKPYGITTGKPDCFSDVFGYNEPAPKTSESGWLCQAGEFLSSGCSPLPWWMCRSRTEWDIYMRGECSCDAFQNGLGDLGIPCHHLIAIYERYAGEPPYCGYVKCD